MTTLELLKEAIEVGHPRDAQALVYQCLEEGLSSEIYTLSLHDALPISLLLGNH